MFLVSRCRSIAAIRHRIDLSGSREVSKVDRRDNLLRHVRMYLGIPKYIYINVDRISIFTNIFVDQQQNKNQKNW